MTEDFKEKLTATMNRGGWGKENIKEAMPLIDKHIQEQLILSGCCCYVATRPNCISKVLTRSIRNDSQKTELEHARKL